MRSKTVGSTAVLVFVFASVAAAQTPTSVPPTATNAPQPTATPLPRQFLGDPTVVNTDTIGNQSRPAVAFSPNGRSFVVWNSDAAVPGFPDIKGQLYSPQGDKIGTEFQVAGAAAGHALFSPDSAADGLGRFIIVWADFLGNPSTDAEVYLRRFDNDGAPLGVAMQANTNTTGRQRLIVVGAAPAGDFVVAWESEGVDGSGLGVAARRYDAAGAPLAAEFPVNTDTAGDQDRVSVAMDADGNFIITFNDGTGGVSARQFGAGGGDQFPVFGGGQQLAHLAVLDGIANTLFVAENHDTGAIAARRIANGILQPPFVLLQPDPGHFLVGARGTRVFLRDAVEEEIGLYVAAEDFDPETGAYSTIAREYVFDGFLKEVGPRFQIFAPNVRGTVRIDASSTGRFQAVRGANDRDGSQSAVEENSGGEPVPVQEEIVGGVLISPGLLCTFGSELTNTSLDDAELNGLITASFLSGLSRPAALTVNDNSADYGTLPAGATGSCQTTGNCYGVTVTGPRPGTHWDEAVEETLNTGVHKTWLLHVGESFADVPSTNPFVAFIENLLHNGVTGGGACGGYCPTDGVKRQQMAVFLLKARFGPSFVPPPATGAIFTDVTLANPFAPWIEALFLLGVTGGCSGGPPPAPTQFCPDAIVNRQQMAVFLIKTLEGPAYTPPTATGVFSDVLPGNPFAAWIEDLYARQVTGGCATGPLRYCPASSTNRQQMAAFLVKTFALKLYGP